MIIAKMDGTANEVQGLQVGGYPTVKFYPKGNKKNPYDYKGQRDNPGPFMKYLSENSSVYKASIEAKKAAREAEEAAAAAAAQGEGSEQDAAKVEEL